MRRLIATVVLGVMLAGCSAGLSDAETVWCDQNLANVASAMRTLDLEYDQVVDNCYSEGCREAFAKACKAAYESR